jgi:uncharacterized protein (TIGR03083 family)
VTAPISVVDLFPGERRALLSLLSRLTADEWALPTACPGWSVHDLALHLFGDDAGRLSRGRDGYQGAVPASVATGGDRTHWDTLVAFINQQNAAWVQGTRRISPRLLCELLRLTGRATSTYFARLDLQVMSGPVDWAGPEPAAVWLDVAREYTERWVHQQQIRDAVGQPGLKERRWLAPVLATFVQALPHALRHAAAPPGSWVQLLVTGAAGGEWWAVRTADAWALAENEGSEPLAIVRLEQETAWRLWTKGLTHEQALQRVHYEGDPAPVAAILDMVTILA